MARADAATVEKLRDILRRQLEIENDWYGLMANIADTDLKEPIANALASCRDKLQSLVDSLQQQSLPIFEPASRRRA